MSQADASVVEKFLKAFTAGELETAISLLHPGIVISEADALPYPGDHVGLEGFQNLLGKMLEPFEMVIQGFEISDAGSIIVVKLLMEFKSRASGRTVTMPSVELYSVADGRIAKIDVYYKDTKALAELVLG